MKSTWKGTISIGLLSVPVKLFASQDKASGTGLHFIHAECGAGVEQLWKCKKCSQVVPRAALAKGAEVVEGTFIPITDADMATLPLRTTRTIELIGFQGGALDPRMVDTGYYLSPDKGGEKAWWLLWQSMVTLTVRGYGKLAMRDREHLCAITPLPGGVMLLQTLVYPDELRAYDEIAPKVVQLSPKETELGEMLVKKLTAPVNLAGYKNEYALALAAVVEAKKTGVALPAPAQAPAQESSLESVLAGILGGK